MKRKILNLLLILASLIGYLEWGGGNHTFLFAAEVDIVTKLLHQTSEAVHPFTVLPLVGQLLLLFTLFQSTPNKKLTYIGIACLGLLLGFMFLIGVMSLNVKILASTLPFIIVAIITIRTRRKEG